MSYRLGTPGSSCALALPTLARKIAAGAGVVRAVGLTSNLIVSIRRALVYK